MANTKASLTQQNTQTYPSNTSGSITANAVKSFNNNFINAVATLGDTNVFTEPQTFGDVVQVNSDVFANNVYAGNIPYLSGSNVFTGPSNTFSGSVNIQTASITFLTVDTIVSSSTIFSSGSNTLGDAAGDVQTLFGTVDVKTGPLKVSGSVDVSGSIVATSFTGSLQGTSSWANNATTASHALTAVSSSFASNATSASFALTASFAQNAGTTVDTGSLLVTASAALNTLTFTKGDASTFNVTIDTGSAVTTDTGSLLTTASVSLNTITFTKGDASTFAITVDTGSAGGGGMNLGNNVFTGSQTLSSSTIPASLILNVSGALPSFVSQSNSTTLGYGNIIFNNRTAANQSGSVIISGSNNIIFEAGTTTTAFKGLVGNSNIGFTPTYSGSIPTFNNNYLAGTLTISGSLAAASNNNIIANANVINFAGVSPSASFNSNFVNASSINVSSTYFFSGSGAFGNTLNNNSIIGQNHRIEVAGSGSQARNLFNNLIGGALNTASLSTPTASFNNSGSLFNTLIYGVGLIVSGTQINTNTLHGGAFIGRYNETGSLANNTVVFAVGSGTSNTARRTSMFVSASGEVVVGAIGGGISGRGHSIFTASAASIVNATVNASTNVGIYNGSFVSNGGSIAGGNLAITTAIIAGEVNTISQGRSSAIIGGSANTLNTSAGADSANMIAGAVSSQISGSTSKYTGIYSSTGSFINEGINSAIIAANNVRLNNTTGSVALGRDTAYTGSANYTLFTQNVDISGSVKVNGNVQYNYGSYYNTSSISLTANTSQSLGLTSIAEQIGFTLSGSNNEKIKATNAGTYNLQFSAQLDQGANSANYYIWFKKNGSNIADSATKLTLGSNSSTVAAWNYIATLAANDTLEIVAQSDANNSSIAYIAASGNIPAIPSLIATITQVK